jgi:uracil-DNA glycosylase
LFDLRAEVVAGVAPAMLRLAEAAGLDAALRAVPLPEHGSILPPPGLVLEALRCARDPADVWCVLVGQDPYPTPGDATGLCFSVRPGARPPPSLLNVALAVAPPGPLPPAGGGRGPPGGGAPALPSPRLGGARLDDLRAWAAQGVLMLNRALTTLPGRAGRTGAKANPHFEAWAGFTGELVRLLEAAAVAAGRRLVLLLWGRDAREFGPGARAAGHAALEWSHPSPQADAQLPPEARFARCPHFREAAARAPRPVEWANGATTYAFADGACRANGRPGAAGGFGCAVVRGAWAFRLSGRVPARSPSATCSPHSRGPQGLASLRLAQGPGFVPAPAQDGSMPPLLVVTGPPVAPSNNRGELLGCIWAMLGALHTRPRGPVRVVTDSGYCAGLATGWAEQRAADGTAGELANGDLVALLLLVRDALAAQAAPAPVVFVKIAGHLPDAALASGSAEDRLAALGNRRADALARAGVDRPEGAIEVEGHAPPALLDALDAWRASVGQTADRTVGDRA